MITKIIIIITIVKIIKLTTPLGMIILITKYTKRQRENTERQRERTRKDKEREHEKARTSTTRRTKRTTRLTRRTRIRTRTTTRRPKTRTTRKNNKNNTKNKDLLKTKYLFQSLSLIWHILWRRFSIVSAFIACINLLFLIEQYTYTYKRGEKIHAFRFFSFLSLR